MEGLSNAQSLRVIGQDLAALGVDAFNLGRRGDEYTVWIEGREPNNVLTREKRFARKIIRMILGDDNSAREVPKSMRFASSQILWTDIARRFNRKPSRELTDLNELSLLLRVVGDFLDKNQADDFIIFWSKNWVKVVFGNRQENFTLLNLYDIGTGMYLKRANRRTSR
ncbi:MAG: hypothetical protein ACREP8_10170 [Candidatus Binatia bacterium]